MKLNTTQQIAVRLRDFAAPLMKLITALVALASSVFGADPVPPTTIKVGITNYQSTGTPGGAVQRIEEVSVDDYVADVIVHEWYPGGGFGSQPECLKAGAIAIKMYAWHRTVNHIASYSYNGQTFDVRDDTYSQVYVKNSRSSSASYVNALAAVKNVGMVRTDGALFLSQYWNGTVTVSGAVNVRSGPGTTYSVVTQVAGNTSLSVVDGGPNQANGYRWWAIKPDGYPPTYTGFIAGAFLLYPSNGTSIDTSHNGNFIGQLTQWGSKYRAYLGENYQAILRAFYDNGPQVGGQTIRFFTYANGGGGGGSSPVTLANVAANPGSRNAGQSTTISCTINSPVAQSILLGASFYPTGSLAGRIDDPANDVSRNLNIGNNSVSRTFAIPAVAASGVIDIELAAWADNNTNGQIDGGDTRLGVVKSTSAFSITATPPPDTTPPSISSFSISPAGSITVGNGFTPSYQVGDSGGSGLARISLRRTSGDGSANDPGWLEIQSVSLSGNSASGSFQVDSPPQGAFFYGIAVFDAAGNARDERAAGLGPIQRTVTPPQITRSISMAGNLAFGSTNVGTQLSRTLTISNSGNAALTVTGISAPTGFTGNYSGSIPAGGSRDVSITFAPSSVGQFSGSLVVNSDATGGTNSMAISGTGTVVQTRVISVTGDLSFGNVLVGSSAQRTLFLRNDGTAVLTVNQLNVPSGFSASFTGSIAPGIAQGVAVTFAPQAAGNFTGSLTVASDATSGAGSIAVSGTATAVVVPSRVISLPASISFGQIQVGASSSQNIQVSNIGNSPLTITSISLLSGYSGSFSGVIQAGQSQSIPITFSPTVATDYNGTLTITSDATSGPNTIALSGFGTSVPQPGAIRFSVATSSIDENAGTVAISLVREGGTAGAVAAHYETTNGTAISGADFTATSGTVQFVDGQTTATINVPITDDNIVEDAESFTVTLSNPTNGATLGTLTSTTINILSDDGNDTDADSDGLADNWEVRYFGGITAQDATGDPDGDHVVNGEEILRNLDPTVANFLTLQPNALIGTSARSLIGADRVDWYCSGQTIYTSASHKRGRVIYFQVRNDGVFTDSVQVDATDENQGYIVRYYMVSGGKAVNITRRLINGTVTLRIRPGKSKSLKAVVIPRAGTALGNSQTIYMDVWSRDYPTVRDSVAAEITVN